jgi:general secretion pathway protein K
MKAFKGSRRQQRGVALIIALVLVALATVLATKLSFDGFLELRRTTGMMAAEQALHFGLGAEALAADVLMQDAQTSAQYTTLAGPWAQATQPLPITPDNNPEGEPIGTMQGSLEDMQGRFNLNNLARLGADGVTEDPVPLLQFQRLLTSVGVEPKWAGLARDWLDQDEAVGNPDGAEDSVYTSQTPPYRTGNWPMLSPTELMNLPGFGADHDQPLHGAGAGAREPGGRPKRRVVKQSRCADRRAQNRLLPRHEDLYQCDRTQGRGEYRHSRRHAK